MARLEERGCTLAAVTLHVGLGTFQPVTVANLDDRPMHAERFDIPASAASAVAEARSSLPALGVSSPVPKLDDYVLPIGRARVVRAGSDVTLVSWSMAMTYALKAADELAKENIAAEVIDLRTLKPMDTDTSDRVR